MKKFLILGALSIGGAAFASAQIMMPDSTSDKVMLFDTFDGHLLNANYIDLAPAGPNTPINAIVVGSEIWVSDQVSDHLSRWTLDGTTWLGNIGGGASGGMDNVRGIEVVGNTVYVSNNGTGNGAPGESVITVSTLTNSITGSFTVGDDASGDPFDVLNYNGNLLVNDIDSQDLETHGYAGTWLSTFHNSDGVSGIDFPEQMAISHSGSVLAAGFSSPIGIYEYNSSGVQINYYAVGTGNRGVIQLGNGNIMYSTGSGVFSYDPSDGTNTTILSGVSGRFFDVLPEPSSLALLAIGAVLGLRRR